MLDNDYMLNEDMFVLHSCSFQSNRSHAAVMMPLKSFDQAEQQRN